MKFAIQIAAIPAFCVVLFAAKGDNENAQAILTQLPTSSERIVSTVPANSDVIPYGVAFVPEGFPKSGALEPGDILVSNFNNSANLQGTGTTIVSVAPTSGVSVFFQGKAGLGLTTALGVLKRGFVIVGNLPTTDGTSSTVQQGSLLVLNSAGMLVASPATRIVSIPRRWSSARPAWPTIPTTMCCMWRPLATTQCLRLIMRAPHQDAGTGRVVYTDNGHLHGPLGLALAPKGDLITANGDAVNPGGMQNELVEFTIDGKFVAQFQVDSGTAGGAFGLAFGRSAGEVRFAAVDDDQNTLDIWTLGPR